MLCQMKLSYAIITFSLQFIEGGIEKDRNSDSEGTEDEENESESNETINRTLDTLRLLEKVHTL